MRTVIYLSIICFLVACGGQEQCAELDLIKEENAMLKERVQADVDFQNSFSSEMSEIDSILKKALAVEMGEETLEGFSSKDLAIGVDSLIDVAYERMDALQEKLNSASETEVLYKDNPVLLRTIENLRAKIRTYEEAIKKKDEELEVLASQNKRQETVIVRVKKERDDVTSERDDVERQLDEARLENQRKIEEKRRLEEQKRKQKLDNMMNNAYAKLESAKVLPSGAFTKKKVKEERLRLLKKAYDLFCEAHNAGVNNALTEMDEMKREFSKELAGKSCN